MATSISKLAVLITGDTRGLAQSTAQGEQIIRNFERRTTGGTSLSGRTGIVQSILLGTGGGRASQLMQLMGRAGPIAVGAVALTAFARAGVSAASSVEELRMEVRALDDEIKGITRNADEFADTTAGQWSRLKQAFGDLGATVTGGGEWFKNISSGLASVLEQIAATSVFDRFGAEQGSRSSIAQERERLREQKRLKEEELALIKQLAEEERKLAEQRQRELDRMKARADSITASLRTPPEVFNDTLKELNDLAAKGLITIETFHRGARRAADELNEATKTITEAKSAGMGGGFAPALEMGTQAARTAALEAKAEMKRVADIAAADKKLSEDRNRLIAETNRTLKTKPSVVLTRGEL